MYVKLDELRFTISPEAFSEVGCWQVLAQTGPGPWNPKVNLLCGNFSRAVICVWLLARYSLLMKLHDPLT